MRFIMQSVRASYLSTGLFIALALCTSQVNSFAGEGQANPRSDTGNGLFAPFDDKSATQGQLSWAKKMGVNVEIVSRATGMKLRIVPAGEFRMGSSEAMFDSLLSSVKKSDRESTARYTSWEMPQHTVRLTKPFMIGKYEVTQAEFKDVMKFNPSWFSKEGGGSAQVEDDDTDLMPVERVSYYDALQFCNQLSLTEKLPAYYRLRDVQKSGASIVSASVDSLGGAGYRLPSEAEWEWAC